MKGINTLIKLSKRKLDELRRQMVQLENQKEQLRQTSMKLQQELENEIALAGRQPEMGNFFGGFAKRIQMRQQEIAAEIKKLEQQMAKLAEQITAAFGELKKYEIARDNAKQRAQAEQNRKDTILLDEIASQQHSRKQTDHV